MNRPIKVLIVDDEDTIRTFLSAFLQDEGFDVAVAADGEEALRQLMLHPVEVGIIDIRLPGIDGNTLIQRAQEICPGMRFLVHTGSIDYTPPDEVGLCGVGREHIFCKPVTDMEITKGLFSSAVPEILQRLAAMALLVG